MNTQNTALYLVAGLVVAGLLGGFAGAKVGSPVVVEKVVREVVEQSFGAFPGGDFTEPITAFSGMVLRNTNNASTSNANLTLAVGDISRNGFLYDTIIHEPIVGDVTITLPASSTLANILPVVGATARQCIHNGTTTAGIDITFVSGTGVDLQIASTTNAGSPYALTALADATVCFDWIRKYRNAAQKTIPGDFVVNMVRFVDGD